MQQLTQFGLTVLGALIGTLTAGAIGLYFGVARFRRERAFERRLAWHENTVGVLSVAAAKLDAVATTMVLRGDPAARQELYDECTRAMPGPQLELEAEMYASAPSFHAIREAMADQRTVAGAILRLTNADDSVAPESERRTVLARMFNVAAKTMLHAASRLATDARELLDLEDVKREVRLYDESHRKLFARAPDESTEAFLARMGSDSAARP